MGHIHTDKAPLWDRGVQIPRAFKPADRRGTQSLLLAKLRGGGYRPAYWQNDIGGGIRAVVIR